MFKQNKTMDLKNFLKLNDAKTQLLCLSSKNYAHKIPTQLTIMNENLKVQTSAKYLGIWLDQNLTFSKQINAVCSQGYIMLKNLWHISSKVTDIGIGKQLDKIRCMVRKQNK